MSESLRSRAPRRDLAAKVSAPTLSRACPECGGPVMRVLRTANDKRRWDAEDWRRFRCRDAMCNWQGLLPMRRRRPAPARKGVGATLARAARALLWLLLALALATAGVLALEHMLQI